MLVAEEVTDRLQRATVNDESINPLVRMVNRIHVVEEARHVRFAREEVARVMPQLGRSGRFVNNLVSALVAAVLVHTLINPAVYDAVGLDPKAALKAARTNPNNHATRRWFGEKIMAFLDEQGMVTPVLSGRSTSSFTSSEMPGRTAPDVGRPPSLVRRGGSAGRAGDSGAG